MRENEENRAIKRVGEATSAALADGAVWWTNSRPLFNVPASYNDTLTTGALNYDNLSTAVSMFSDFKNHQGGPMYTRPTDGLTHAYNMMKIEEIMRSQLKAHELSNTKNVLPNINWHYSTYMSSKTAWMIWDKRFDHLIFQWFLRTTFDQDEDKIQTKNLYFNAVAMWETGVIPQVGIVGSAGT